MDSGRRRGGEGGENLMFNAAGELCSSASTAMFHPMECKKEGNTEGESGMEKESEWM